MLFLKGLAKVWDDTLIKLLTTVTSGVVRLGWAVQRVFIFYYIDLVG